MSLSCQGDYCCCWRVSQLQSNLSVHFGGLSSLLRFAKYGWFMASSTVRRFSGLKARRPFSNSMVWSLAWGILCFQSMHWRPCSSYIFFYLWIKTIAYSLSMNSRSSSSGTPIILRTIMTWLALVSPGNRVARYSSSAKMQPTLHISRLSL